MSVKSAHAVSRSTRDEILATALRLFTVRGYDATSLRQIADELGLTKAAIYYHFPAKEHLTTELAQPFLSALANLVTFNPAEPELDDTGRAELLGDYLDLFVAHHALVQFLSRDPAAQQHPDVGQRGRALVVALQTRLAGTNAGTADRIRATCAISAIHAVALLSTEEVFAARDVVLGSALAALTAGG